MLNTVVLAAIPRAMEMMMARVTPGVLRKVRTADRTSRDNFRIANLRSVRRVRPLIDVNNEPKAEGVPAKTDRS